jgi:EF hand
MGGGISARIIFSLMDSDGDGKLSLDEFRAAHDRIFKAMDTDKDGTVTMKEMMDFMRGTARPAQPVTSWHRSRCVCRCRPSTSGRDSKRRCGQPE